MDSLHKTGIYTSETMRHATRGTVLLVSDLIQVEPSPLSQKDGKQNVPLPSPI